MAEQTFKRKLTPFLAQEMLFDYAEGRLDAERKAAIEDFLEKDQECREILETIRKGNEFAASLGHAQLKPEALASIRESENAISLGRRYSSWKEWPEAIRWSITAILVSVWIAGTVALIPWSKLSTVKTSKSDTIEIAQLQGSANQQQQDAALAQAEAEPPAEPEGSGDDIIDEEEAVAARAQEAKTQGRPTHDVDGEGDERAQAATGTAKSPGANPSPASVAAAKAAAVAAQPPPSEQEPMAEAEHAASKSQSQIGKPKGFVYRGFMTLSELEEIGPKITSHIIDLGGQKAGEVELGWKRGSGRYYHFALPAANEEKLLEKLRAYGPVRISKDPHPRVMPEGQVRFILWIESAN